MVTPPRPVHPWWIVVGELSGSVGRPGARERLTGFLDALEFHRASDVDTRLTGATLAEREAVVLHAPDLQMRARLVRADMLQRTGHPTEAGGLAIEVNRWARQQGAGPLLARSHLVLASVFESIGDAAACLDHAVRAVEALDADVEPRTRGNFLTRLADAFAVAESFDAARQRYREAQRIFVSIGDVERQLNLLNNLAYAEVEAGDAAESRRVAEEMRRLADASGLGLNPAFLDTLARAHIGVGEYVEAEAVLGVALRALEASGDIQAMTPAELLLTLAQAQRLQGHLDAAQESLDRCLAVSVERDLSGIEVDAMREQSELHAAAGRFDLAYEAHRVYHAKSVSLGSERRDAAARTRQALFETTEARQEAQRYWRQARTDPMTGLPNRRFVDEELPNRLASVANGTPLVVAIVDVDNFKRVNDSLSHEAGDRVICAMGTVLQEAIGVGVDDPDGAHRFVARLGGEEYLVVLPGLAPPSAIALLEDVRARVEGHDWHAVCGEIALTVSIGVTIARATDGRTDLMARADRNLYAAKHAGRNRVVVDQDAGAWSQPPVRQLN
jgi:two-component system, cell cycle response regulator